MKFQYHVIQFFFTVRCHVFNQFIILSSYILVIFFVGFHCHLWNTLRRRYFCYYGVEILHSFKGIMYSPQYIYVFRRRVVPVLQKRNPYGFRIFQQYLAPCHTSKVIKSFKKEENIQILEWPNANPIEHLCKSTDFVQ